MIIPVNELNAFLGNHQANPHGWLGMHPAKVKRKSGVVVRAFRRGAVKCSVIELDTKGAPSHPMEMLAPEGFFEVFATAVVALIFTKLGLLPAEDDHRRVLAVLRYLEDA